MEDQTTPAVELFKPTIFRRNRLAIIGFGLMLAGPAVLILAGWMPWTWHKMVAFTIAGAAMVLPGAGVVLSVISLFRWKKTDQISHALSIITLIMCNPLFYYFYYFICHITGYSLAGIPWM